MELRHCGERGGPLWDGTLRVAAVSTPRLVGRLSLSTDSSDTVF